MRNIKILVLGAVGDRETRPAPLYAVSLFRHLRESVPRLRLFEFLDQPWCPQTVRDGVTDCLEAITSVADAYAVVRPLFLNAIQACGADQVVDLCSGGGGPWLSREWSSQIQNQDFEVVLTDKFPSLALATRTRETVGLRSIDVPVDATTVPRDLPGFRTIFSSFHHFPDRVAAQILEDAVRAGRGFASAEVTSRSLKACLTIFLLPLAVWLLTPTIRPFRWSRLLFTYLFPAIPFVILWDGLVSCLRTRTPEELLALARPFSTYQWKAGYAQGSWLAPVYLIGIPKENGRPESASGVWQAGAW